MPVPTLHHFFLVVAVGLAALGAISAAPGNEAELRACLEALAERCARAEGPEDIVRYYAEDATHINVRGEWVPTAEMLAGDLKSLVGGAARFEIEKVSFIAERVALVDGTLAVRGTPPGGEELDERFAFVMKKTQDGWKIAASRLMFPEER